MRATACIAALALCGCTAIVDGEVGDLEVNASAQQDIGIRLVGFEPHVGQLVDIMVVDPTSNLIQARAVVDTLPSVCLDVRMRRAAPVSATQVDFYADLNMNRMQDNFPEDHTWRCDDDEIATPCMLDGGRLTFPHNFTFQDIFDDPGTPIGGDVDVRVTGVEAHDGQSVTAQLLTDIVVNAETGDTETTVPGLYFLSSISGGEVSMRIPGIADGGRTYALELTFGDGTTRCTLENQTAPTSGDFPIDEPLSSFTCDEPAAVDCAALQTQCDDMGRPDACATLFRRCAIVDCAR